MGSDLKKLGGQDPVAVQVVLILVALFFFVFILILPIVLVFAEGLKKGITYYFESFQEPIALEAIKLTLLVTAITVPLNTVFGLFAAWAIAKFRFPGKTLLTTLLDLPFAVSPVIVGLVFILLLGSQHPIGAWLSGHGIQVIFAPPGIIIATLFITFPFVARELIPLMQSQGTEEEEAAIILGASGWKTFWKVTLPNVKWGLFYGMVLCNARAIGEFGAVSVVSGHIRGQTNTLPLHIEILYNEYKFAAAFAVSTLLVMIAALTLAIKAFVEWRYRRESYTE